MKPHTVRYKIIIDCNVDEHGNVDPYSTHESASIVGEFGKASKYADLTKYPNPDEIMLILLNKNLKFTMK